MSTQQEASDCTSTSPARKSRLQEKQELAYLNDRFASYIEQVRSLKELNLNYEYEVKILKEQLGTESDEIKKLFEAELSDARTLIDETAKEKARQQLNASKNAARCKEMESEVKELKEELESLKTRTIVAERNAASMEAQKRAALIEKSALQKEMKDKDAEIEELRANVEELRSLLEAETLCKVDYQNNLQSLNEELSFRKKIYEEELREMRSKLSNTSVRIDTSLDPSNLENIIDELREKSDTDIADYKDMVEAAYKEKLSKLESVTARDSSTISQLNTELRRINTTLTDKQADVTRLQKAVEKLEHQLEMKDSEISRLVQKHTSELRSMSEQIQALRENYDAQLREYEALMDIKVQLDQEIATYRALLQEEENRLNLTPTPRREKRRATVSTTEQVIKKPRFDTPIVQQQQQQQSSTSSSAAGCIQICEVDPSGRFVQIKNMSTAGESVGGFKIVHDVSGQKEIAFKFHQKSKLQGGADVTVWGSEADGAVHNPPHDIIWRTQPTWGAGSNAVTKLVSKSGEVVATFTQRSETTPVKSRYDTVDANVRAFPHLAEATTTTEGEQGGGTSTRVTRTATTRVGQEHMFHQQGDPPRQERLERESCVIC